MSGEETPEQLTLDDLIKAGAGSSTKPVVTPPPTISPEEAAGYLPESERGVLSASPEDTATSTALKYIGTGGIKALSHIPGLVGDIQQMGDVGTAYLSSLVQGKPFAPEYESLKEYKAKHPEESMFNAPSGEDIQQMILPHTGEYKPTSPVGRAGMAGIEAMAPIGGPSAKLSAAERAWQVAREAVPAFTSGAAAQVAGEQTGNPFISFLSGIVTGHGTSALPVALESHFAPSRMAGAYAGKTMREAAQDPEAVQRALELAKTRQEPLVPGVEPTTSQIAQDPGLAAMYAKMNRDRQFTPEGSAAASIAAGTTTQEAASKAALESATLSASQKLESNLSAAPTRQAASTDARQVFSNLEENADQNVNALWKDPKLEGATMYKNRALGAINDYVDGLSAVRKSTIPKEVTDVIDTISSMPGRDIPLGEIQDLRSQILAKGREAFRAGNGFTGGQLNNFAKHIADNVIGDGSNIVFGDRPKMPKTTPLGEEAVTVGPSTAREAWQNAVNATREYHQTFNSGFLKKLNKDVESGVPSVSLDSTFDVGLRGDNATQNLAQMQKATNGAINRHVEDYLMASDGLTRNGTRLVKPQDVDKWLGQKANSSLVDMVPGMRERLAAFRDSSVSNQLSTEFAKNASDPDKIVKMFEDNRADITKSVPEGEQAYFRALEASAKKLQSIPEDKLANLGSLNKLASGSIGDVLYGAASGRLLKGAAGLAAAHIAGHYLPDVVGPVAETLSALIPSVGGHVGVGRFNLNSVLDPLVSGGVRDRAIELLQQAKSNPELAAKLMDKADPSVLANLFVPTTLRGAAIGAEAGREGRATGGKVGIDHETESDRLVKMVDDVRNDLGSHTEANLNQPDEMVIKALAVANRSV
jgi:hypothetical protein